MVANSNLYTCFDREPFWWDLFFPTSCVYQAIDPIILQSQRQIFNSLGKTYHNMNSYLFPKAKCESIMVKLCTLVNCLTLFPICWTSWNMLQTNCQKVMKFYNQTTNRIPWWWRKCWGLAFFYWNWFVFFYYFTNPPIREFSIEKGKCSGGDLSCVLKLGQTNSTNMIGG